MRVPWTAKRSNRSILKEINSEYSLEGLMIEVLILWPPDAKSQIIGKDSDAGKDQRQRRRGRQRMRWLDSIINAMDMNLSKLQETAKNGGSWCAAVHIIARQTHVSNSTTTISYDLSGHTDSSARDHRRPTNTEESTVKLNIFRFFVISKILLRNYLIVFINLQ